MRCWIGVRGKLVAAAGSDGVYDGRARLGEMVRGQMTHLDTTEGGCSQWTAGRRRW